jgi:hypothetical protein
VSGAVAPSAGTGLERLRELLLDGGGLLAGLLREEQQGGAPAAASTDGRDGTIVQAAPQPALLAAAGPRAEGRRAEYETLVEAIYEGYLLHYREPRLLRVPEADLGLLAGDRLYAIGLAQLVALGDTGAVAELADTITLSALAHGAEARELADAVWEAGASAVGWGSSEMHRRAKRMVLEGDPGALDAMRTSVRKGPAPP